MRERLSQAERNVYASGGWHDRDPRGAVQLTLEVDFEAPIPAPKVARSSRRQEKPATAVKRDRRAS